MIAEDKTQPNDITNSIRVVSIRFKLTNTPNNNNKATPLQLDNKRKKEQELIMFAECLKTAKHKMVLMEFHYILQVVQL